MMTMGPFFSPALSFAAARDLDADAESESAARRRVFRGGDSDRVGTLDAEFPLSPSRNLENAADLGRESRVSTSTAIVAYQSAVSGKRRYVTKRNKM